MPRRERLALRCEAWLADAERNTLWRCRPVNVSESGLLARAAPGARLRPGKGYGVPLACMGTIGRTTVRFEETRIPVTVLRVERVVGTEHESLEAAVRFERPLRIQPEVWDR